MAVVRPAMAVVAKKDTELWACLTMVGVLAAGFVTDLIGIHAIFGAFVFGLMIPKEDDFAGRLIERIEDFVSGLLLPLYFASSGLKTDVAEIKGGRAWGSLVVVTGIACVGKMAGTFAAAVACRMPAREAAALGMLMSTKGLVELIVLNIGRERKVRTRVQEILLSLILFFLSSPRPWDVNSLCHLGNEGPFRVEYRRSFWTLALSRSMFCRSLLSLSLSDSFTLKKNAL